MIKIEAPGIINADGCSIITRHIEMVTEVSGVSFHGFYIQMTSGATHHFDFDSREEAQAARNNLLEML
jgi:hypothetical protein